MSSNNETNTVTSKETNTSARHRSVHDRLYESRHVGRPKYVSKDKRTSPNPGSSCDIRNLHKMSDIPSPSDKSWKTSPNPRNYPQTPNRGSQHRKLSNMSVVSINSASNSPYLDDHTISTFQSNTPSTNMITPHLSERFFDELSPDICRSRREPSSAKSETTVWDRLYKDNERTEKKKSESKRRRREIEEAQLFKPNSKIHRQRYLKSIMLSRISAPSPSLKSVQPSRRDIGDSSIKSARSARLNLDNVSSRSGRRRGPLPVSTTDKFSPASVTMIDEVTKRNPSSARILRGTRSIQSDSCIKRLLSDVNEEYYEKRSEAFSTPKAIGKTHMVDACVDTSDLILYCDVQSIYQKPSATEVKENLNYKIIYVSKTNNNDANNHFINEELVPRTIEVVQGPAQIKHDAVVLSVPKDLISNSEVENEPDVINSSEIDVDATQITHITANTKASHNSWEIPDEKISLQDERTPPRPKSILEHTEVDITASYDMGLSKLSEAETPVATTRRKVFNININLTDNSRNVLDEKEPSSTLNPGASICTSDIEDLASHEWSRSNEAETPIVTNPKTISSNNTDLTSDPCNVSDENVLCSLYTKPSIVNSEGYDLVSHEEFLAKLSKAETPAIISSGKDLTRRADLENSSCNVTDEQTSSTLGPKPSIDMCIVDDLASCEEVLTKSIETETPISTSPKNVCPNDTSLNNDSCNISEEKVPFTPDAKLSIGNTEADDLVVHEEFLAKLSNSENSVAISLRKGFTKSTDSVNGPCNVSDEKKPSTLCAKPSIDTSEGDDLASHKELLKRLSNAEPLFTTPNYKGITDDTISRSSSWDMSFVADNFEVNHSALYDEGLSNSSEPHVREPTDSINSFHSSMSSSHLQHHLSNVSDTDDIAANNKNGTMMNELNTPVSIPEKAKCTEDMKTAFNSLDMSDGNAPLNKKSLHLCEVSDVSSHCDITPKSIEIENHHVTIQDKGLRENIHSTNHSWDVSGEKTLSCQKLAIHNPKVACPASHEADKVKLSEAETPATIPVDIVCIGTDSVHPLSVSEKKPLYCQNSPTKLFEVDDAVMKVINTQTHVVTPQNRSIAHMYPEYDSCDMSPLCPKPSIHISNVEYTSSNEQPLQNIITPANFVATTQNIGYADGTISSHNPLDISNENTPHSQKSPLDLYKIENLASHDNVVAKSPLVEIPLASVTANKKSAGGACEFSHEKSPSHPNSVIDNLEVGDSTSDVDLKVKMSKAGNLVASPQTKVINGNTNRAYSILDISDEKALSFPIIPPENLEVDGSFHHEDIFSTLSEACTSVPERSQVDVSVCHHDVLVELREADTAFSTTEKKSITDSTKSAHDLLDIAADKNGLYSSRDKIDNVVSNCEGFATLTNTNTLVAAFPKTDYIEDKDSTRASWDMSDEKTPSRRTNLTVISEVGDLSCHDKVFTKSTNSESSIVTTSSRSTPVIVTSKLDDVASHKEVLPKLSESETPAATPQNKCTIENVNPAYESSDMSNKHASLRPKPFCDEVFSKLNDYKILVDMPQNNSLTEDKKTANDSSDSSYEQAPHFSKQQIDNVKVDDKASHDKDSAKISNLDSLVIPPVDSYYTDDTNASCNSLDISVEKASPFPKPEIFSDVTVMVKITDSEITAVTTDDKGFCDNAKSTDGSIYTVDHEIPFCSNSVNDNPEVEDKASFDEATARSTEAPVIFGTPQNKSFPEKLKSENDSSNMPDKKTPYIATSPVIISEVGELASHNTVVKETNAETHVTSSSACPEPFIDTSEVIIASCDEVFSKLSESESTVAILQNKRITEATKSTYYSSGQLNEYVSNSATPSIDNSVVEDKVSRNTDLAMTNNSDTFVVYPGNTECTEDTNALYESSSSFPKSSTDIDNICCTALNDGKLGNVADPEVHVMTARVTDCREGAKSGNDSSDMFGEIIPISSKTSHTFETVDKVSRGQVIARSIEAHTLSVKRHNKSFYEKPISEKDSSYMSDKKTSPTLTPLAIISKVGEVASHDIGLEKLTNSQTFIASSLSCPKPILDTSKKFIVASCDEVLSKQTQSESTVVIPQGKITIASTESAYGSSDLLNEQAGNSIAAGDKAIQSNDLPNTNKPEILVGSSGNADFTKYSLNMPDETTSCYLEPSIYNAEIVYTDLNDGKLASAVVSEAIILTTQSTGCSKESKSAIESLNMLVRKAPFSPKVELENKVLQDEVIAGSIEAKINLVKRQNEDITEKSESQSGLFDISNEKTISILTPPVIITEVNSFASHDMVLEKPNDAKDRVAFTSSFQKPVIDTRKLDDFAYQDEVLSKLSESEKILLLTQNESITEDTKSANDSTIFSNKQTSCCPTSSIVNLGVDHEASHDKYLSDTNRSEMLVAIPGNTEYTGDINASYNSLDMSDGKASQFSKSSMNNFEIDCTKLSSNKLGNITGSEAVAVIPEKSKAPFSAQSSHSFEVDEVSHDEVNARLIRGKALFVKHLNKDITGKSKSDNSSSDKSDKETPSVPSPLINMSKIEDSAPSENLLPKLVIDETFFSIQPPSIENKIPVHGSRDTLLEKVSSIPNPEMDNFKDVHSTLLDKELDKSSETETLVSTPQEKVFIRNAVSEDYSLGVSYEKTLYCPSTVVESLEVGYTASRDVDLKKYSEVENVVATPLNMPFEVYIKSSEEVLHPHQTQMNDLNETENSVAINAQHKNINENTESAYNSLEILHDCRFQNPSIDISKVKDKDSHDKAVAKSNESKIPVTISNNTDYTKEIKASHNSLDISGRIPPSCSISASIETEYQNGTITDTINIETPNLAHRSCYIPDYKAVKVNSDKKHQDNTGTIFSDDPDTIKFFQSDITETVRKNKHKQENKSLVASHEGARNEQEESPLILPLLKESITGKCQAVDDFADGKCTVAYATCAVPQHLNIHKNTSSHYARVDSDDKTPSLVQSSFISNLEFDIPTFNETESYTPKVKSISEDDFVKSEFTSKGSALQFEDVGYEDPKLRLHTPKTKGISERDFVKSEFTIRKGSTVQFEDVGHEDSKLRLQSPFPDLELAASTTSVKKLRSCISNDAVIEKLNIAFDAVSLRMPGVRNLCLWSDTHFVLHRRDKPIKIYALKKKKKKEKKEKKEKKRTRHSRRLDKGEGEI